MTESPAVPPRARRWVLLTLLVMAMALAWTGYRAVQARHHLERARSQLELARIALLDRRLDDAQRAVTKAGHETGQARALTGDIAIRALSHLPLAGRSLLVVRGIAESADEIARTVLPEALDSARALDPEVLRRSDGAIDLELFDRARPNIALAATRAERVAKKVRALPTRLVLGAVAGPQRDFVTQSADLAQALRGATDALDVAPALLGADKPRRWFVLVQQTSEARGTGGVPGGFAILETDRGRLRVTSQGSNVDFKDGQIAPEGLPQDFTKRYDPLGSFANWRNVNLSPDLPLVSRYLVQRWKAQTGQSLDGVISLDAVALADLLEGGEPIEVGPGHLIPAQGIQDYLAIGQYPLNLGYDQTSRKENLTVVSRAVIDRLSAGTGDMATLLKGVSSALRSGHIRIATDDPFLAPVLRRAGADGGLPHDGRPFAYPVVFNAAGSKLDYFLARDVTYAGESCGGNRRRTRVTLRLRTDPPALKALPFYVTIRQQDGRVERSLVDRLGVSVYATKGARLVKATLDGKELSATPTSDPYVEAGTEAGLPVWLTYMDVHPADERVLVLTLDEPVVKGAPRVIEQPLARPLVQHVQVPACR